MCVRIHHVTKNAQGLRRRQIEQGKISLLLLHALVMPPCSDRTRKFSLSGGETAYSCRAGSRGSCLRCCWRRGWKSEFLAFLKNKRLPYLKKISASSKLKKVRITNVLVNFLSVRPLLTNNTLFD